LHISQTYRNLLCRLGEEDFESVAERILAIPLENQFQLQVLFQAIYTRALAAPQLAELLARLCQRLQGEGLQAERKNVFLSKVQSIWQKLIEKEVGFLRSSPSLSFLPFPLVSDDHFHPFIKEDAPGTVDRAKS